MYSEATKALLEASEHMAQLRAEQAAKKAKQKQTMSPINVRFPSSVESGCKMLDEKMENWNKSDIARAAMYLGLKQLNEVMTHDPKKANGLMHLIKMRAALGK